MAYITKRMDSQTGKIIEYRSIGSIVKAAPDGNRISGYLVRFTNENDRDLHGEWFDKRTNFWLKEHPLIGKPIMIDHAFDAKFKSVPVGLIDFAKEDEVGIWIEGKLKERQEYKDMLRGWKERKYIDVDDEHLDRAAAGIEKAVKVFFGSGEAQWSSGALPQAVEMDESTKHIKSWPMIEATGVFTPAEPDGTQISLKSLWEDALKFDISDNSDIIDVETPSAITPIEVANPEAVRKGTDNITTVSNGATKSAPSLGLKTMEQEELIALIRQIVAEMMEAAPDTMAMEGEDEEELKQELEEELKQELEDDEELKMEDENEEMKRLVKRLAIEKTKNLIVKKFPVILKRLAKAKESRKNEFKGMWESSVNKAIDNADTTSQTGGVQITPNRHQNSMTPPLPVRTISPYQLWTPEDFSFAVSMANMSKGKSKQFRLKADETFYREFADKAQKAYETGKLRLTNNAIKGIHTIKADELDYSTQAGFGDEWVPTIWADNVWDRPRLDNVIQNIFDSIEMPGNPYEYPVESTDPTVYYVTETKHEAQLSLDSTTRPIPSSKVATDKVTFTARKFGLQVQWSSELEEDGIARLVPKFREQAERAMQDKGIDNIAFNGDTSTTTNINADGETITATTRNYLAYDGLIHQPLVTATTNRLDAQGASPTLSHLRQVRSLLGSAEGYSPQNLAWIMDFPTYIKLLNDDTVVTIDKYGAAATVVTGELGRIDGIPVFVSAEMALADSDGKITDGGNVVNRGRALLVHRPSWLMGFRRRVQQSLDYLPWFDVWLLTITLRQHFLPRTASDGALQSTDDSTAILYNIGV